MDSTHLKRLLAALVLLPSLAIGAANDMLFMQRNATDNGTLNRLVAFPVSDALFYFNSSTLLPGAVTLGSNLTLGSGVLDSVPPNWTTLAGKPSFATVAFTGNYGDLTGTPAPATPSQSAASRSLNTIFQISTTRGALGIYSIQCTITASIAGGQNCDIIFEIASDSGFTANGQTYTLAVTLQGVQPTTKVCTGFVPANYYVRLRTVQNTGTPSFSYRAGQE